eukprot:CAMPEP_0172427172 /NCGR_PEP_ID=MMETSP1064-20121228/40884_1 /TAXON_ID=202472 /ORGANISM="Aulacoseira subarctica , Strain CCAP 1002/5" /LENGTH=49 /DNA_ID=CAMNT_0013171235 /DNA_START=1830 /DNA_END=1979 /DNA_ORIENTATION=-
MTLKYKNNDPNVIRVSSRVNWDADRMGDVDIEQTEIKFDEDDSSLDSYS